MNSYDVIIIGGGPAGLSAGLYAGRAKLSALIIEKEREGGQIVVTSEVENYPGCIEGETGETLIDRMVAQTEKFGVEHLFDTVRDVKLDGRVKKVICDGGEYEAKALIIATGAYPISIGCPGERELTGLGVSYCATCDAPFFRDLDVCVVGGGDSAVEEALYLTKFARGVTIIHRRDELRAARSIQEKAFADPKVSFMWNSVIEEIKGNGMVESMIVRNVKTGKRTEVKADPKDGTFGIFVFIGHRPNSALFSGKVKMDEKGYIPTDENMQTSVPGVFAAGDVRVKSLRQVVTAAADGANAVTSAERYLNSL